MDDEEVNTLHRWNHYCRAVSKEGDVCALYAPHDSVEHVSKHGKARWRDGE